MFESKRFWKISALSLLGLNLILISMGAFLIINRPQPRYSGDYRDPVSQLGRRLELSPEQRTQLRDSSYFQHSRKTQSELFLLRRQLLLESRNDSVNPEKIDSLANAIGKIQAQMEREHAKGFRRLRDVASPEQRQKLDRMMQRVDKGNHGKGKRNRD